MGVREMRTFWASSAAGLLCALLSGVGVVIAATTERHGLGALLIIGGLVLLLVFVALAAKLRKPDQPF